MSFRAMSKKFFGLLPAAFWRDKIEDGKYDRAGGDVECVGCGEKYVEHPGLPGLATFHLICDGQIVKL